MPRLTRRRLATLFRDYGGVAAIEFAIALPVLCMMVFGLWEVSQGVICYYKMIDAANSIADLIGQTSTAEGGVGKSDFDNLYTAGQLIMSPNTGSALQLAVASVTFNSTGKSPTQAWQIQRGGAAAMTNDATNSATLGVANGSVIVVQATYQYSSALNYFITAPITMTYQTFAFPRNLTKIACPPPNSGDSCK